MEGDGDLCKYDMTLFDKAYDLLADLESPDEVAESYDIARAYFRGTLSQDYTIEILSEGKAKVINDISTLLT